ncbi:unnamed protein product [Lactuca virosa]|uniref:Uncharacterized protein n=1 Tax=Lactuca virosa TaxID=75947 RepID=A0AAU9LWI1_9ASTR|nr:unnamed protein product [Lactuca virosa]
MKLNVLKEIAQEYNISWDSSKTEAEFNKKLEDLLSLEKWHLTDELTNDVNEIMCNLRLSENRFHRVLVMNWDSEDEGSTNPFSGLREPFSGLNEMDFELHGIYMDHESEQEFVTPLDKCKDVFLNVLQTDERLRNSSLDDEVRTQVYHGNDWQSDQEEQEQVKNKYIIHYPKTRWDKMEPKLGNIF